MGKQIYFVLSFLFFIVSASAQSKHAKSSNFTSYKGLVMAGYQGWFRAPEDEANKGWGHYGVGQKFDFENNTIDFGQMFLSTKKPTKLFLNILMANLLRFLAP